MRISDWSSDVCSSDLPALPGCPGHALWKRDFTGASRLFSFVLNGGSDAGRVAMIDGLKHFGIGYSWGGYESRAMPIDPQKYRAARTWAAGGQLVGLKLGIGDPADHTAVLSAVRKR